MTVITATPSTVDAARWPSVATVPRSPLRAALATALARRVFARLPIRVVGPDGAVSGGGGPDAPALVLHRPVAFFRRLGAGGLIGFGEAYQAGDWDSPDLPALLTVFAARVSSLVPRRLQWLRRFQVARQPRMDENTVDGARRNIHRHYDLSNDLFALFLDDTMTYSAALFGDESQGRAELSAAQHRKIDRLLDVAGVGPGTRLLEIGTGWGELAIQAARRGAWVRSVTISTEQRDLAQQRIDAAGVGDRVQVELSDYREVTPPPGGFDAAVSVEMIEAVGEKYWPSYFSTVDNLIVPGGRFGLQAITMPHERVLATRRTYTWMHKYIFPGGLIPSVTAIDEICRRQTRLRLEQTYAFGQHYARTLRLWRERFTQRRAELAGLGFDHTFERTWRFYLAYCEAGFASGYIDVHQLLLRRAS
jgi:cyclopropane-fatty-acyl-phospholipid synthase